MAQHDDFMQVTDSGAKQSRQKSIKRSDSAALLSESGADVRALGTPQSVLTMQRLAGNAAVTQLLSDGADAEFEEERRTAKRSPVLDVIEGGGGRPLGERTEQSMQRALGADLSGVRIHDDETASRSAEAINARAYTVGNDIVFRQGAYQPDTAEGQKVLAHELTHVVQQRTGPVDGELTDDGIALSDPDDRFERAAEANAERIVANAHGEALKQDRGHPDAATAQVAQRQDDEQAEEEAEQGGTETTEAEEEAETESEE